MNWGIATWIRCHKERNHVHLHCTTTDTTCYSVVRALVAALLPRQWKGPSPRWAQRDLPGLAVHTQTVTTDLLIHWKSRLLGNSFLNHGFGVYLSDIRCSVKRQTEKFRSLPLHPCQPFLPQQYRWLCFCLCQNSSWLVIKHTFQTKKHSFWRLLYPDHFRDLV